MLGQSQIRTAPTGLARFRSDNEVRHRVLLWSAWLVALVFLLTVILNGLPYYRLDPADRPGSPYHAAWRSSGTIGRQLGILGATMFCLLLLFPLRKRWPWLSRLGKTRHWLDFHVLLGITTPVVITLHSSLKFRGVAGMAYWIMAAVAASGVIGRYLYAQIPRRFNATELTLQEIEAELARLRAALETQTAFAAAEKGRLMQSPARGKAGAMSVAGALWRGLLFEIIRPFSVSRLRRRFMSRARQFSTLGGLLPSSDVRLEAFIAAARSYSGMASKLQFLDSTRRVFHLWHVVHRPFSVVLVVLVAIHISVALLLGYL